MVLSLPRGSAGPELPALRAAPASAGRAGSWGRGIQILIQLSPAEHGHRRVASGAVSEPAARMPIHGAAAGAESDWPGIRKDILRGYPERIL